MSRQSVSQVKQSDAASLPTRSIFERKCECGNLAPGGGSCASCSNADTRSFNSSSHGASSSEQDVGSAPAENVTWESNTELQADSVVGLLLFGHHIQSVVTAGGLRRLRGAVEGDTPKPAPAPDAGPVPVPTPATPPAPPPCTMTSKTKKSAPDGTANTRKKVGVSEEVTVDVGVVATWSAPSGTITPVATKSEVLWTAPEAAGAVTLTATVPATGAVCTSTFDVILPSDLTMTKKSEDTFPAGTSGAGMRLQAAFPPNDVSFNNSEWLEDPGPASNVTGYFAVLQRGGTDLSHHPNLSFVRITASNTYFSDHAAGSGFPNPWSAGTFDWVVPNRVRKFGGSSSGTFFRNTTQAFTIASNGAVTISKGGDSVSRTP